VPIRSTRVADRTTFVGFLRAVNVAGRTVAMDRLRRAIEATGFSGVRTVLNSGNVVFHSDEHAAARVERRLEAGCSAPFGRPIEFIVRDLPQLEAAIAANPFAECARKDPSHLLVIFLKSAPSAKNAAAFARDLQGPEEGRVCGTHAYVTYPDGIGRSKITLPRIEAAIGTRGTGRNWNTVHKLAALARTTSFAGEGG
jgi:uncharacterized protein (DUF1697 family)